MKEKKVLIIDDEVGMQQLLYSILSLHGWEVEIAKDSYDAIDRLLREESFDLLLSDLRMPDLCGHEIWQEVKKQQPKIPTKAILLSGTPGDKEFVNAVARYGFDGKLAKPFGVKQLLELIHSVMGI